MKGGRRSADWQVLGCEHDSIFPAVFTLHAIYDIQLWKYRARFCRHNICWVFNLSSRDKRVLSGRKKLDLYGQRDPHHACPHPARASWDLQLWQREISSEVTFEQRRLLCFQSRFIINPNQRLSKCWLNHTFLFPRVKVTSNLTTRSSKHTCPWCVASQRTGEIPAKQSCRLIKKATRQGVFTIKHTPTIIPSLLDSQPLHFEALELVPGEEPWLKNLQVVP